MPCLKVIFSLTADFCNYPNYWDKMSSLTFSENTKYQKIYIYIYINKMLPATVVVSALRVDNKRTFVNLDGLLLIVMIQTCVEIWSLLE